MPFHFHAARPVDWERPELFELAPLEIPIHHAPLTGIVAGREAFTADSCGRILRWTRAEDSAVDSSLWREGRGKPAVQLALSDDRLAWVEAGEPATLHVAELDRPEATVQVATCSRGRTPSALRFSPDGSRLWAALPDARPPFGQPHPEEWGNQTVVGLLELGEEDVGASPWPAPEVTLEAEGWSARLVEVALLDSKRQWADCAISVDGRLLVRRGGYGQRRLVVPSADVSRSTKLLDHRFGPEPDALIGLDMIRGRVVSVPAARDRATVLGPLPEPGPMSSPRSASLESVDSSPSQARAAWIVSGHKDPWRLIVADALAPRVVQVDMTAANVGDSAAIVAFWGEDELLVSTYHGGFRRVRIGETLELDPLPAHDSVEPARATLWPHAMSTWCATSTAAYLLDRAGRLLRFDLETGTLESLGQEPELGKDSSPIRVFDDGRGEVMLWTSSGPLGWRACGWRPTLTISTAR